MKKSTSQSESKLRKSAAKKFLDIIEKCGLEVAIDHAEGCIARLSEVGDTENKLVINVYWETLGLLKMLREGDEAAYERLVLWAKTKV